MQIAFVLRVRCGPRTRADNHGVAEGEDGYLNRTKDIPVGLHLLVQRSGFKVEIESTFKCVPKTFSIFYFQRAGFK